MKNWFKLFAKKISARRIIVMLIGNLIMGLGVAIFKYSLMGNDPCNASYMAIAASVHIPYAYMAWIMNGLLFVVEIIFGRHHIGIGTFVNWFAVGPLVTLFSYVIESVFVRPESFVGRLPILVIGILVLSLSCSLYQKAEVGVSPYDSIAIIVNERSKIPYFVCRVVLDGLAALVTWLLGGIVGLGTLVCAFGLGPFISMFDKLVSERLVRER